MANGIVWLPPFWDRHGGKHFLPGGTNWATAVPRTGLGKAWAKYHPLLTESIIEAMEMSVFDANGRLNTQAGWQEISSPKPHIRMFWRPVHGLGHALGASDGVETSYQYVEYASSGSVHGRPITPQCW